MVVDHAASGSDTFALLVEGSAVARKLLERVLSTALRPAFPVVTVRMPQDAPADLSPMRVALVDIDLDDTEGLTLLGRLPPDCWRVATTLYEEDERLLPALETGIHGYLLKQDRYERQVEMLQMVMRGRPELSPSLARALLDSMRRSGAAAGDPVLEQTLASLGSGLSMREAARAMETTVLEVQGIVARAYALARRPVWANQSTFIR